MHAGRRKHRKDSVRSAGRILITPALEDFTNKHGDPHVVPLLLSKICQIEGVTAKNRVLLVDAASSTLALCFVANV